MNGPPGSQVAAKKRKRKHNNKSKNTPGNTNEQNTTAANSNRSGIDSGELNTPQAKTSLFQPPRQEHVYVEAAPVSELYGKLLRGTSSAASASSGTSNHNRRQMKNSSKYRAFDLQRDFTELPYPRGMVNNSNFCFMNSILQALLFIPAFAQVTVSVSCDALAREYCPTLAIFGKWMLQYWKPGYTRLAIAAPPLMARGKTGIAAAVPSSQHALDGSVQEDAQEFLQKLLERIQQELVLYEEMIGKDSDVMLTVDSGTNSLAEDHSGISATQKGWTVVKGKEKLAVREHVDAQGQSRLLNAIFGGTMENHLQGKQRQRDHVSVLVEKYFCVPVSIAFAPECTMEEALEYTFAAEKIYDSEREKNLKKTLRFGQLPSVLFIQVRRWAITREGELVKLNNVVHLRRTLEIPRSICGDQTLSNAERSYRLLSVVCHRGNAVGRGHYVTYLVHHAASPEVMRVQATSKDNEAKAVRFAPPSTSVVLCNDANISVVPAKSMEMEAVYFVVYQKMN